MYSTLKVWNVYIIATNRKHYKQYPVQKSIKQKNYILVETII